MSPIVVVFDFDYTLLELDSQVWLRVDTGFAVLFCRRIGSMTWTEAVDRMMVELHENGKTIDDITESLRRAPIHPRVISAVKTAHALGCDLKIISNANQFFIETILKQYELFECFSEIITNPSSVDQEGRVRISHYHDDNLPPHGCELCPRNLCKGLVLDRIRTTSSEMGSVRTKYIYVGHGEGDYCPSMKLKDCDFVMPRKRFDLWKQIEENPSVIKAEVHEWSNYEEFEEILISLINKSMGNY